MCAPSIHGLRRQPVSCPNDALDMGINWILWPFLFHGAKRHRQPNCAHENATHFHVHLNWCSSSQMLLFRFWSGMITLWCLSWCGGGRWLPFNLARFKPQWKRQTPPTLRWDHSAPFRQAQAKSEICQKNKKITTRLFVNRNWAQFKREHHNGQWLWVTVNLMFLHRTGQEIYFHRALTENLKKNECLRALKIMFELFRCRFYNRNKNASLLNGIERFSGSKRIILRNEYFFSLK